MNGQILAQRSGHADVRGSQLDLRVSQLNPAGILVVIDGDDALQGHPANSRDNIHLAVGLDAAETPARECRIEMYGSIQSPVQFAHLALSQHGKFLEREILGRAIESESFEVGQLRRTTEMSVQSGNIQVIEIDP